MTKDKLKRIISAFVLLAMVACAVFAVGAASPNDAQLKVIDVSKWNNSIDWSKTSGQVDGVIARIGYRGSVNRDSIAEDNLFSSHYNACVTYSIPFSCYFFSTALNTTQAVEEAKWVISTLKKYNCKPEFPIYIDMEDTQVQNNLTNSQRTAIARAFCDEMTANGYYPGVYANKYWMTSLLNMSQLTDVSVWVAQYASQCSYAGRYDMWQYTETGSVNGVNGNVDVNICYRDYPSFIKENGYNGHEPTGEPDPNEPVNPPTLDSTKLGTYKITATSLNVRSGAGTSNSILGSLKTNDEVYIYDEKDGWGMLSFGSSTGWISLNAAYSTKLSNHITTKKSLGFYVVNTDVLNVRDGAGTSNTKIGTLNRGDTVFITQLSGNWGSYYYSSGKRAWISLDYAVFNGAVSFESCGGGGSMRHQLIKKGQSAALSKSAFTYQDKIFSGWAASNGGAKLYDDMATLTMGDSNIILYALYSSSAPPKPYSSLKGSATVDSQHSLLIIRDEMIKPDELADKYFTLLDGATHETTCKSGSNVGTGSVVSFTYNGQVTQLTVSLLGDVNGDGVRDGLDLADVVSIANGSAKVYSQSALTAADLNSDSTVDSADALIIKDIAFRGSDLPL